MRCALLIGFEYTNNTNVEVPRLPAIIIDLYSSYMCFKDKVDKIIVYTDVVKDSSTKEVKKAIVSGKVDSGILSFIENIREYNMYRRYKAAKVNGFSRSNLEKVVEEMSSNYVKKDIIQLFVYYTGHAKNNHMILPDNSRLSLTYFKHITTGQVVKDGSILYILDCCNGTTLSLPYIYHLNKRINNSILSKAVKGVYKLNIDIESIEFSSQRIICLASSSKEEDAMTSKEGSLFSSLLFDIIADWNDINNYNSNNNSNNRYLPYILYSINNGYNKYKQQTATLAASHPNLFILNLDNNVRVDIDLDIDIIKVFK